MNAKTIPISQSLERSDKLYLLKDDELKNLSGGTPKAIAGWKAAAFLVGGTLATVLLVAGATYFIYQGVKYVISD